MPWKTVSLKELVERSGMNYEEFEMKHRLINQIIRIRKRQGSTQAEVAKRLGISQARIAKIESGIGTDKITFDALIRVLAILGYTCKVTPQKASGHRSSKAKTKIAA